MKKKSIRNYKKDLNSKQYREMLNDICDGLCSEDNQCVLKDFLLSAHTSPRLLMQMKCAAKFKKVIAGRQDRDPKDIEMSEAMDAWVQEGYATKFSEVYEEGVRYDILYKKVMDA
jgi:hypothetical protein